MLDETPSTAEFAVVVNDEDQWSIWPAHRTVPAGWTAEGTVGSRGECIEHIDASWTDIRSRSVRDAGGVDR
ncbi:MAG: MbtH family protein [Kutzneria sp.]|nr:MbtH family protein [Kutzneria sp.]MBV9847668.1 MbtH family protein [Kutzneria sp.]